MKNKLLLIGLDGATFDLLDPLIEQGRLPNLGRLRREGISGSLTSTIPPVSVPAWPSFATGRNPGKTGMYDFLVRKPGAYRIMPSPPMRLRAFWETLSQHGLRVGVVNVPGTYPPRPVNGFIVTGMMTPSTDVEFTYPSHLGRKLHELTGGYKLDCERGWWEYAGDDDFVAEINELIEQRFKVFSHLMDEEPWDFLCLVITETDRFHHRMWKHIDTGHPGAESRFNDCFDKLYARLDAGLGQILSRLDEGTNVIVMSDHGFGPCRYSFSPLIWLQQEGYLKLKRRWRDHTFLRKTSIESIVRVLERLKLKGLVKKILPERARLAAIDFVGHENLSHSLHRLIDWSRTTAYALPLSNGYGNIFINLKGREPEGIVAPGLQAERIQSDIQVKLQALRNPLSNAPTQVTLHRCSDIYTPDPVLQPPDLIFGLDDYSYNIENGRLHGDVFQRYDLGHHSGSHRSEGIFMAAGPDFKSRQRIDGLSLLDLAPTCQFLMDVPIAHDIDGQVLTKALADSGQAVETSDGESEISGSPAAYTEEEAAQIESRLKQLGYID
jgi:predicted AlkP superfamily phosphohydrolase/phosphomutase